MTLRIRCRPGNSTSWCDGCGGEDEGEADDVTRKRKPCLMFQYEYHEPNPEGWRAGPIGWKLREDLANLSEPAERVTAGMNRAVFSSATDRWATPTAVYAALDREFRFDFDPCPLDGEVDGLSIDWGGKRVFCNPPYGPGIDAWLERGLHAACAVYLIPARTDTKWFHAIVLPRATEIRFLRGRLKFGDAKKDAPFPSMVVVFGE